MKKHKFSNPSGVIEAIRNAAQRLHPDWKEPEEKAREHLAAAAEEFRHAGDIEAFKRTSRLQKSLAKERAK